VIPDWQTNAVYFAASLPGRLPAFWERLRPVLVAHGIVPRLLDGTRDIWLRDFLPVQVREDHFVKFRYDPDYLKRFDHLRTGDEVCELLSCKPFTHRSDLCIDGGNVVAASGRVILTDKVYRENAGLSRERLRQCLQRTLETEALIIVPKEPGDIFGHSDGMVRFLDEDLVVMSDYAGVDPGFGRRLRRILERHHLRVEFLPYRIDPKVSDGVASAVGNYVNFLALRGLVLVPAYGLPEDEEARTILRRLLPGHQVVSLDCTELAERGGVLHCCSWTLKVPAPG
jgi:agmatine deiminase